MIRRASAPGNAGSRRHADTMGRGQRLTNCPDLARFATQRDLNRCTDRHRRRDGPAERGGRGPRAARTPDGAQLVIACRDPASAATPLPDALAPLDVVVIAPDGSGERVVGGGVVPDGTPGALPLWVPRPR